MIQKLSERYRMGMQKLISTVGYTHPQIDLLLILHHRLLENLDNTLLYGDMPLLKMERVRILQQCNVVCLQLTQKSFASFCELPEGIAVALQNHATLRDPEKDRDERASLDTYLREMRDLLLQKGLLFTEPASQMRRMACERTLSVLRLMDGVRKGEIISFLYGTELIFRNAPVISLAGAELTQIYLAGVNMAWVNLAEACLMRGNLAWVNLAWANLEDANLFGADLFLTDLGRACLVGANLQAANLFGADLAQAEYDASTQWPIGFDPVAAGAIEVTRA